MSDYQPQRFEDSSAEEWERRFKARILAVLDGTGEWSATQARYSADNEFESLEEPVDMTISPEESADECLSYWDDDESCG